MLDRITGMQLFARAMQAGSISAAGRELGLSPGMASRHLDALEKRLGVRLCHRSTRRLSLTEAGQHYLELCLRLLPELEEVEAQIASQRVEASGVLRFNVPLSLGVRYIAPLLPAFHEQHPAVMVDLGLNDRVVDLTGEGWDLTIRVGRLRDSRLISRRLAHSELMICASPDYLSRRGRPRFWTDLPRHDCLGFSLSGIAKPEEWLYGRFRDRRVSVHGPMCANNGDALVACASAGLGIIYEPDFIVADAVRAGALEVLVLDAPSAELGGVHLLYSPDRAPPAKVRVMIDFLVGAFGSTPPWGVR
ncbi:LysR family transcriptional regulator [Gluconobacter sp. R75690]|uniref:LysR family transcriptional regulator n=1 Tax=Gluconobacter TaxID=441 RepID=UPI00188D3B8F|nr:MULTISPECIES: LysR family transcriptional regulator [unclassified Gluconobacter]MBF0851447.1 LysR family transcriptional regulator [Gluconobacter sp. R75690]MBF0880072.1 LysR family transcriptional regulator [Gluconobacter sp. R75828]